MRREIKRVQGDLPREKGGGATQKDRKARRQKKMTLRIFEEAIENHIILCLSKIAHICKYVCIQKYTYIYVYVYMFICVCVCV